MTPTNLAFQSPAYYSAHGIQPRREITPLAESKLEWHLQPRGQSGVFIASTRGTLLCRYDSGSGLIHLWDKKGSCEVTITIADLNHLHEVTRIT